MQQLPGVIDAASQAKRLLMCTTKKSPVGDRRQIYSHVTKPGA